MKIESIAAMVKDGESETLELKKTTNALRSAAKTICAMLNQRGGHVLFGVTPEGSVTGQQVSDHTLEKISTELRKIEPPAFPEIQRIQASDEREVVMITVRTGPAKPYMYGGKAYRRIANTTVEMRSEAYNRMLLECMHREQRWENQAADGWSVEDLDRNEILTTVDESIRRGRLEDPGTRDIEELVRGLGLFQEGALLRAAVALFGKAKQIEFRMPQCMLRVARFKGVDRTEFLDNRQFYGNTFYLLKAAESFLRDSLPIAGYIKEDSFERIDEPLFPVEALREALANALCHRDYSIGGGSVGVAIYDDRLEITSTGTLHFDLTPEKLFATHSSLPWNPMIARTFYRRGIIEEWGRGTLKILELIKEAGLPDPEIEDDGTCVTVCFRHGMAPDRLAARIRLSGKVTSRVQSVILNKQQQMVVDALAQADHPLALREIFGQLQGAMSMKQIKRALSRLRKLKYVELTGHGASARWSLSEGA